MVLFNVRHSSRLTDEDAKRPTRERENLVGERTRSVNRIKAALARLGVRDLNPALRKAASHVDTVRTPEGASLPALAKSELRRDMARLRFIEDQIKEIGRSSKSVLCALKQGTRVRRRRTT
jgi:transposase